MWNEEQVKFIKGFMDEYQFSAFTVDKKREITDILYYIKDGFLEINTFETLSIQYKELENNYKALLTNINVKKENLEKELVAKNDKIKKIKENTSTKIEERYNKEYKSLEENNKITKLTFKKSDIGNELKKHYEKKEHKLKLLNKIIKINYIIITTITLLYAVYIFIN